MFRRYRTPVHVQLVIVKEAVLEGWEAALSLGSWSNAVWSQINRIEWLRVKNIRIRSTHFDVRGSTVLGRSFDIVCCWDTNSGVTLDHAWPEPCLDRWQGLYDRATITDCDVIPVKTFFH
ncbi:hypothetical protein CAEBREN_18752 [Caenorhabditis brenneri]|uniref:Uncharacterized protein n=1 Tax=Caenorhabditis brenneri TaxID=135651 RepID=G0NM84_CAEBE|nr:hypothetical protein CAEBREN_18752 [Caenorhabditis brenneri]